MAFIRNTDDKRFPVIENLSQKELTQLTQELFPNDDMDLDGAFIDIVAVVTWIDEQVLKTTSSYLLVSYCAPGWIEDDMDFVDPVIRDAHLKMDDTRLGQDVRDAASAVFYGHAESPMEVAFGTGEFVPPNLKGRRFKIAFMTKDESEASTPGDFLVVSVDENGWLIGTSEPYRRSQ